METLTTKMETLTVINYCIYTVFIVFLTWFVAKNLFKNSKTFMMLIFNNREELALATNRLFEVGFFLFSFGIGLRFLTINGGISNYRELFEILSEKTGAFTLFMGMLLFINLYLFFRGMKHRNHKKTEEVEITTN
jgi:hypothetical protein